MSKKALLSLLLIGVLAFGAGLGTYAWFTSTATSQNNEFEAGTIQLDVNGASDAQNFEIDLKDNLIQPSDVLTTGEGGYSTITIRNKGNLPMATFGRFTLEGNMTDEEIQFARDIKILDYSVRFYDENDNERTFYDSKNPQVRRVRRDDFIVDGVGDGFALNIYDWVNGRGPRDLNSSWDMEALRPGDYFTITFRLAYDESATLQGQKVNLGYEVKSTQVNLDAINDLKLEGAGVFKNINYLEGLLK